MTPADNIWDRYAAFTDTTALYPVDKEIEYLTLGIVDEGAEMIEKIITDQKPDEIKAEIGDVLWYLVRLYKAVQPEGSSLFDLALYTATAIKGELQEDGLPHLVELTSNVSIAGGRIAGRVKKWLREPEKELNKKVIVESIVSLLGALGLIALHNGYTLAEVLEGNIEKLSGRKVRGTLKGDGDHR